VVGVVQADRAGDEGQTGATEGARVDTGRPVVLDLRFVQVHRDGDAESAQALGQIDDVGVQAHPVEGEVAAGAAVPDLDLVDDEQGPDVTGEVLDLVEPLAAGDVDPSLGLDHLDDEGGRRGVSAGGVGERRAVFGQSRGPTGNGFDVQAHHDGERRPGPLPERIVGGGGQ